MSRWEMMERFIATLSLLISLTSMIMCLESLKNRGPNHRWDKECTLKATQVIRPYLSLQMLLHLEHSKKDSWAGDVDILVRLTRIFQTQRDNKKILHKQETKINRAFSKHTTSSAATRPINATKINQSIHANYTKTSTMLEIKFTLTTQQHHIWTIMVNLRSRPTIRNPCKAPLTQRVNKYKLWSIWVTTTILIAIIPTGWTGRSLA